MTDRILRTVPALLLAALAACGDGDPAIPECTTHEGCPAKQYCDEAGVCAPLDAGACRKVADCDVLPGGPAVCVDDACAYLIACRHHEDCPAHQECNGTTCQALAAGACRKAADCGATEGCEGDVCVAECDLAVNLAKRAELLAAQPALAVAASSGKQLRTFTKRFLSAAGTPDHFCSVQYPFKDLSGDGALQPYEDWTLPAAVRAADLVSRLTLAGRRALLALPALSDVPAGTTPALTTGTEALVDAGVRSGLTAANTALVKARAAWSNALQARCEASPLGVPFLLSSEPAHTNGPGRTHAKGFASWPPEAAFGAGRDVVRAETWGRLASQEYRALGIRMVLQPSANVATDPRWPGAQWTFGEDFASVSAMAGAFVKGAQGAALGKGSVAVVLGEFPGAGAAKGGWDARLAKGKYTSYPGGRFEDHARAFDGALAAGVAGVSTGRAIPEAGPWTAFGGTVSGASLEQVGASFNGTIVSGLLRGHLNFGGLVVAPAGVVEEPGLAPLGTPWGVEALTRPQRIAKAVGAGVDLFVGLSDLDALAAAGLEEARVSASATRVLELMFRLGLFEDPYVDATTPGTIGGPTYTDEMYRESIPAMYAGMVLLRNVQKPAGWLNGAGDGTQTGDKWNAGNGTLRVLPAPPGEPYPSFCTDFYVAGDWELDYVNSVAQGYGCLANAASFVKGVAVSTDAGRMALSDYVLVRIAAPASVDPDSGSLALPLPSLTYAGNDAAVLAPVAAARAAIDGWAGTPASKAQLVVVVDAGRPSVVAELLSGTFGVSALYVDGSGTMPGNPYGDKVVLDVMFGIQDGTGKLPFSLPASDEAAAAQLEDVAGDGAAASYVRGYGLQTRAFWH